MLIEPVEKSLGISNCSSLIEIEYIVESDLGELHHAVFGEDETRSDEEEEVRECYILYLTLHIIELFESFE